MGIDIIKDIDIKDELMHLWETGGPKVWDIGLVQFRGVYGVMPGSCTDWTGYPVSGKTELVLEINKNLTDFYGHRHLLHMPDAGTQAELTSDLIEKFSLKTFKKFYYDGEGRRHECSNRITEKEIYRWKEHVMHHFHILTKKNSTKPFTPKEIWDFAADNKKDLGIHDVVIDSWNYLRHDTEGFAREDKWLEYVLSYRNELAQSSGLHFHTIIHPHSPKIKDGKIQIPTEHNLKGGSEWFNNAKFLNIVHRENKLATTTEIHVKKRKRAPGFYGMTAQVMFDVKTRRYFEYDNKSNKQYAQKYNEDGFEF